MKRALYLVMSLALALAAGVLTLRAQQTVTVVVATRDLATGTQITAGDVEVRRLHDDGVAGSTVSDLDRVVGQYVAWPLTAGQPILQRAVRAQRSGTALADGLAIPDGYRAVAVPVQPANAVGGMLAPGDHVDVYASPSAHETANSDSSNATVLLGQNVLVLEIRSDQGQPLDVSSGDSGSGTTVHGLNFGTGKLGAVVIAVPNADVDRYARAAGSQTIYLALGLT